MTCQNCEEKRATHYYGNLYHLCDECDEKYLYEVAKDYGLDNKPLDTDGQTTAAAQLNRNR